MKMKIWRSKDFYAGLIFALFGLSALLLARRYPVGTASRMGPGYFPSLLGWMLAVLGLVIAARALWVRSETNKSWALRPLLLVIGAVLGFAVLVRPLGLVLATIMLVVTSCLGSEDSRLGEVAALCILLVVIAVALFVWGLGITLNIWPL